MIMESSLAEPGIRSKIRHEGLQSLHGDDTPGISLMSTRWLRRRNVCGERKLREVLVSTAMRYCPLFILGIRYSRCFSRIAWD